MENQKVQITTSKQFTVNLRDVSKGLLTAAISSALMLLYPIINSGNWPTHSDWVVIIKTASASALGYLIKNFLTPSQTIVKVTPPVEEKLMDTEVKQ